MNLRELMKQEKHKRRLLAQKVETAQPPHNDGADTVKQSSRATTMNGPVVVSSTTSNTTRSQGQSGGMTGYESDDEGGGDGAETDGSVNSRPPDNNFGTTTKDDYNNQRQWEISELERLPKRRRQNGEEDVVEQQHLTTIRKAQAESVDSGYEAESETITDDTKKRKSNADRHFKETLRADRNGVPDDFFDAQEDLESMLDKDDGRELLILTTDAPWVEKVHKMENVIIKEEIIWEDSENEEVSTAVALSDTPTMCVKVVEKPEDGSWVDNLFDETSLNPNLPDDELIDYQGSTYQQTAQFSVTNATETDINAKTNKNGVDLPVGFFADPELDSIVRGKEAPSVQKSRQMERAFQLFQTEIDEVQQQQEILQHRKEVDKQLHEEAQRAAHALELQDLVLAMKKKQQARPLATEEPTACSADSDEELLDVADLDTIPENFWRHRRMKK